MRQPPSSQQQLFIVRIFTVQDGQDFPRKLLHAAREIVVAVPHDVVVEQFVDRRGALRCSASHSETTSTMARRLKRNSRRCSPDPFRRTTLPAFLSSHKHLFVSTNPRSGSTSFQFRARPRGTPPAKQHDKHHHIHVNGQTTHDQRQLLGAAASSYNYAHCSTRRTPWRTIPAPRTVPLPSHPWTRTSTNGKTVVCGCNIACANTFRSEDANWLQVMIVSVPAHTFFFPLAAAPKHGPAGVLSCTSPSFRSTRHANSYDRRRDIHA